MIFLILQFVHISISCIDSQMTGRTSRQHGVAWWVNKRLVGEPSWKGFDEEAYLDARTMEAKRYTFVVEADLLADDVQDDWSDFKNTERFISVRSVVRKSILDWLRELMKDVHISRKIAAVSPRRRDLRYLPITSRHHIGSFVDELQGRVTWIDSRVLDATVEVLTNLEKARTGYDLLEQLAHLDPNDLDELNEILKRWSVQEARLVLDELDRRLRLIESLENLVEDPSSDELHDIQPLFEKGLWIFGPEYESLQFISNKSLSTIIEKLLEGEVNKVEKPRRRPDFVALPDSSIGVYSHDAYDERGEVEGIGKVLIVELKRGGFQITQKEISQTLKYATEIRRSGKIGGDTQICGFILGTTLADDARDQITVGHHTVIHPHAYSTVLRMAHARTFNLINAIKELKEAELVDPEIEKVISEEEQGSLDL